LLPVWRAIRRGLDMNSISNVRGANLEGRREGVPPCLDSIRPLPDVRRRDCFAFVTVAASGQAMGSPERTATAVNMNNGRARSIDITVDRWSTDTERDALIARFVKNGPDKLLDSL
jgi:hypothetical protein